MKNFTRLTLVLVALSTLSAVAKDKKPPLDIEVVAIHETSAFTIHDEKVASFNLDAIVEGQHVFLECAAPSSFRADQSPREPIRASMLMSESLWTSHFPDRSWVARIQAATRFGAVGKELAALRDLQRVATNLTPVETG